MTAHTKPPVAQSQIPNDLDAYWMPFTPNKRFKAAPRFVERAEGMYYYTPDGRQILDGASGLWCVSAGHGHPRIVEAIQRYEPRLKGVVVRSSTLDENALSLSFHISAQLVGEERCASRPSYPRAD